MKTIVSIFLFLFFNCACFSQKSHLSFFKITYVDFDIETVFSISCNYFEKAFEKNDFKIVVLKTYQMQNISKTLQSFKIFKWKSIDTRGKLKYQVNGHYVEFCFDQFGTLTDGKHFYKNNDLFKVLKKLFPTEFSRISLF